MLPDALQNLFTPASHSDPAQPNSLESTRANYSCGDGRGSRSLCRTSSLVNRSPNRSPSAIITCITRPEEDENSRLVPPAYVEQTPDAPPPSYQEVMKGSSHGHKNVDLP